MNKMSFAVNNQRTIEAAQLEHDGSISITKYDNKENQEEDSFSISAGDFITMLNWYSYQKRNGNYSLYFE